MRHLDLYLDDKKHPTRRLARLLEPLADEYDAVILDCSPGITLTSESVFAAVDALLVPIIPTTLSIRTLDQLTGFLDQLDDAGPMVLPFGSMVDRRKKLHRETVERLRADVPSFLATEIPNASIVERMGVERAPLATFAPKSPGSPRLSRLVARHLGEVVLLRFDHRGGSVAAILWLQRNPYAPKTEDCPNWRATCDAVIAQGFASPTMSLCARSPDKAADLGDREIAE